MLYLLLIISAIIGILVCIKAKKKYGILLNHYTIMNVWWHFILWVSFYSTWYNVSINTYLVFFVGLFFFNITIMFIPNHENNSYKDIHFSSIKKRRFLELITFLLLTPFIMQFYNDILSGNELWMIRNGLRTGDFVREYQESATISFFLIPIINVLSITAYYKFYIKNKKYSNILSLLTSLIFVIILGAIDGGGRGFVMLWLYLYIICIISYSQKKAKIHFNDNARFNIFILAIPIVGILTMTILRGILTNNEYESFLLVLRYSNTHFVGLLDYYLKHPDTAGFNSYTLGLSTFENIFLAIQYPFRMLIHNSNYFLDYKIVDSIIQSPVYVGEGLVNAQVSMYFRFIRDWGYIGILIGPVLLALFFHKLFKFALKDSYNFLFYIYSLSLLINSSHELLYSKISFLLTFCYFMITKKILQAKNRI